MTKNEKNAPILKIGHRKFLTLVDNLVSQIKKCPEKIFGIVPIPRGGLVLGAYLSHRLNDVPVLNIYNILEAHPWWFRPKGTLLIVDDVVDNGTTLIKSKILDIHPHINKKVACLIKKPWASVNPDFCAMETDKWVKFDWEVK